MPTIAQQLTQLESDRSDLVDNLETKGITGLTGNETFTELVPEVLNIPSGGGADLSEYFKTYDERARASHYIKKIPDITVPSTMSYFFSNFGSLSEIPFINTSSVTLMNYMFQNCSSLITIPLLDTSSATSATGMFSGCTSLTTVPAINISNATETNNMFSNCSSLTSVPQFNTSKVKTMTQMFSGCTNLTTIPVLNTSNVEDGATHSNLRNAFQNCPSLSNETLNNILQMCINATKVTKNKNLASIGLTQIQATTCQSLSNWSSFVSHGWSTGY